MPQIPVRLGGLDAALLDGALCVVVSPGSVAARSRSSPRRAAAAWRSSATSSCSRAPRDAPVAGITGTNGKSTVTTLLGAHGRSAPG